jgi:hypothetical protein
MRALHRFIKTKQFKSVISDLDAWNEVDDLKLELDANPTLGRMIVGGEGLRKVRMGLPGTGKSGGARVIYYQIVDKKTIALLFAYSKSKTENLTPGQVRMVLRFRDEVVKMLKEEPHEKDN